MGAQFTSPAAVRVLENAAKGSAFHAYLISGPKGSGKMEFARIAGAALLCTGQNKPCGECSACAMIKSGNHPDMIHLSPDGKSIKIKEIRTLLEELSRHSFFDGKRIVILEDAGEMTVEAQNCLLKTLEEPLGQTHFFLLVQSPEAMLPTIRSRCVHIRLGSMEEGALIQALISEGAAKEDAELFARLSGGVQGQAKLLAADKYGDGRLWNIRKQAILLATTLKGYTSVPKGQELFKSLKEDREGAQYLLNSLTSIYRDMMILQTGADELCVNVDIKEKLVESARRFTKAVFGDIIDLILLAQKQLDANVNYLLAADALLLSISEVMNGKNHRRRAL